MNKIEWRTKTVLERMNTCYKEAATIRDWSAENKSVLAIGLYHAYENLYGSTNKSDSLPPTDETKEKNQ